jgi:RNA polymerase sigma factor (TIGR02999 family)
MQSAKTAPEQDGPAESADRLEVTRLLHKLSGGNREAFDELIPLVYGQLRRLASRALMGERAGHSLRATALVHEAYLRLAQSDGAWQDRIHFYAVAARVMRHILVDHAKAHNRQKRGGGAEHIALDEAVLVSPDNVPDVVDLDNSLRRLAEHDERKSQVIELLFFGGLTYEEAAAALNIAPATVHREVRMAKAWLYRDLAQQ